MGQSVIDFDEKVEVQFDGKLEADLSLEASLIDGFTYRFPVELSVADGVVLDELTSKTVCQCASIQFEKKSIGATKGIVKGQLLLRPKSIDLHQTLDVVGLRPGELDPVRIGRINVNCKVFSPLRLVPSVVEVKENRFPNSIVDVKLSKGVEVVDAKILDSNGVITGVFKRDESQFLLEFGEAPLKDDQGELLCEMVMSFKGKKATYTANIPYAPKSAIRVIPAIVVFRKTGAGYLGRLAVVGFGPSEKEKPSLALDSLSGENVWQSSDQEFLIDHFAFGKAFGRLVLPDNQLVVTTDMRTRLRLRDKLTGVVLVEFDGVLSR